MAPCTQPHTVTMQRLHARPRQSVLWVPFFGENFGTLNFLKFLGVEQERLGNLLINGVFSTYQISHQLRIRHCGLRVLRSKRGKRGERRTGLLTRIKFSLFSRFVPYIFHGLVAGHYGVVRGCETVTMTKDTNGLQRGHCEANARAPLYTVKRGGAVGGMGMARANFF
jgi:hypothetical protein